MVVTVGCQERACASAVFSHGFQQIGSASVARLIDVSEHAGND